MIINFEKWINLNLKVITWDEKFLEDFKVLWEYLFSKGTTSEDHFKSLRKVKLSCAKGPLHSWLEWLEESYLIFCFEYMDYTVIELSEVSEVPLSDLTFKLRSYYIKSFPLLEEDFNELFLLINPQDKVTKLEHAFLRENFEISRSLEYYQASILKSFEVTLFDQWEPLLSSIKNEKTVPHKKKMTQRSVKKNITELVILFVLTSFFVVGVKYASGWYENYLSNKITLFEPYFFWGDDGLNFKKEDIQADDISLSVEELEKLEKLENKLDVKTQDGNERFEVESDVLVTSLSDQLKNFEVAETEDSSYEEQNKGGFRNFSYGRRKAYRVMMTSVDTNKSREKVNALLGKFDYRKVDKVEPGKSIPGGVYFNLYLSKVDVKKFLSGMNDIDDITILESRTIVGGPKNMSNIFIWIKSI